MMVGRAPEFSSKSSSVLLCDSLLPFALLRKPRKGSSCHVPVCTSRSGFSVGGTRRTDRSDARLKDTRVEWLSNEEHGSIGRYRASDEYLLSLIGDRVG